MYPSRYLLRSARLLTLSAARAGPAAAAVARPAVAAFARPAAMQPFSSSNRQLEGTRFRGGPLWERGDVVEYEELKPLTESPDDVSRAGGGDWGLSERGREEPSAN